MAFRDNAMGAEIRHKPRDAAKAIVAAFSAAKGDADKVAKKFDVTRRTLNRWLRDLQLQTKVVRVRSNAKKA